MAYCYEIEIRHDGLKKYRHIRGTDKYVVEQKAAAQQAVWYEMWEKQLAAERKRAEKEQAAQERQTKKELAAEKTAEAEERIDALRNTLKHTLAVNDAIAWESLKDFSKFPTPQPLQPIKLEIPPLPKENDQKYSPKIGIFDCLFFWVKNKKKAEAEMHFYRDVMVT